MTNDKDFKFELPEFNQEQYEECLRIFVAQAVGLPDYLFKEDIIEHTIPAGTPLTTWDGVKVNAEYIDWVTEDDE